jgi:hypothetical protein
MFLVARALDPVVRGNLTPGAALGVVVEVVFFDGVPRGCLWHGSVLPGERAFRGRTIASAARDYIPNGLHSASGGLGIRVMETVMETCRACGEPIEFVKTRKGKRMPVDPELETVTLAPGITVVTAEGDVLRGSPATQNTKVTGYTPHWDTCQFAARFRRGR